MPVRFWPREPNIKIMKKTTKLLNDLHYTPDKNIAPGSITAMLKNIASRIDNIFDRLEKLENDNRKRNKED